METVSKTDKHTPGPWNAIGEGGTSDGGSNKQHPCFCGYVVAPNGQKIIGQHSLIGIQGSNPKEAQANAKLIAAAPELLEALKVSERYHEFLTESIDWLADNTKDKNIQGWIVNQREMLAARIRTNTTAIKKAEQ